MKEHYLKIAVAIILIVSQFLIVIALFFARLVHAFDFDELTTSLAMVFPILVLNAAAGEKYIRSLRLNPVTTSPNISPVFSVFSIALPILYTVSVGFLIYCKSTYLIIDNFDQFKLAFGAIQTIFGAGLGRFIAALFD